MKTLIDRLFNRCSGKEADIQSGYSDGHLANAVDASAMFISECELPIRVPDFAGYSYWDLIYNGRDIYAKIRDDNFLKQVQAGKVGFSGKSSLVCSLEIKFTKNGGSVTEEEYIVHKVFGIKERESGENESC